MTLKQRLELMTKQNEEMLGLMRQLARSSATPAPAKKGAAVDRSEPPPRRWNDKTKCYEIFLQGSGWIRDYDNRPAQAGGGR